MDSAHGFSTRNALIVIVSTSVLIAAAHAEPRPDARGTLKAISTLRYAEGVRASAVNGETIHGSVVRRGKAQSRGNAGAVAAIGILVGVVQVTAATSMPKVGARWPYTVRAAACTKGAAAKLTAEIVDPIGRKHPVCFGTKPGEVTDISFTGTFKDFIVWPSKSVGYPLRLRITIVAGGTTQTVDYKFTVRD
jgi:hypothetical protein